MEASLGNLMRPISKFKKEMRAEDVAQSTVTFLKSLYQDNILLFLAVLFLNFKKFLLEHVCNTYNLH